MEIPDGSTVRELTVFEVVEVGLDREVFEGGLKLNAGPSIQIQVDAFNPIEFFEAWTIDFPDFSCQSDPVLTFSDSGISPAIEHAVTWQCPSFAEESLSLQNA